MGVCGGRGAEAKRPFCVEFGRLRVQVLLRSGGGIGWTEAYIVWILGAMPSHLCFAALFSVFVCIHVPVIPFDSLKA